MPRIVLVGAGSVEFTRNLLGDILTSPALQTSQIALHDIDPERLATAERMARWTAAALDTEPAISAHLDRREALRGADFVINTIQVGGARATHVDFDIPASFGLRYTIADTVGVGGVFRGLRTIPVVLGIARDMEDICPDAWLLNYTNPLAVLVRAVSEATSIRVVGLCHSVFWTIDRLAGYLGLPRDEVDAASAGLNHLAFVLRLEHRGRDLYPELRAFVEAGRTPDDDLVRAELFRRLGYYPTESSEHHAEYNPWYIGKRDAAGDAVERFHIPIGEYLDRVSHNLGEYAEAKRRLDAGESFEIERSGEYAATIAEAMTTGTPARIVVNAMNGGALIPNLDADACVEVPGLVDGLGVHPIAMEPLPLQLAAYVRGAVDMQGLTVRAALDRDRAAIGHAVMTDPIVQSHLTLDDAWRLTESMIEAEAEWLPAWLGGGAADYEEEHAMFTDRTALGGSGWQRLLAIIGGAALLVSACGGSTPSPSSAAPTGGATASGAPSPSQAAASASPAASDAGYTGPEATITYSIWGDPQEIKAQQAIVDAFHVANPKITVKVTVSDWEPYWDKLLTSITGGDAPDVFAMDGPYFPDYQTRGALLDLKPYIDRDGYDLGLLADQAVADFTTPDGQFGLPRDLNVVALYYNKKMFDDAGVAYPDDTWDWAKLTEVAKKLTIRDAKGKVSQWGFYTETTDMENYWSELVWQNGGDIISADDKTSLVGSDQAAAGLQFLQDLIWKEKVMPDAAITDALGDAFEQGQAAMESNGSWLVATHQAAKIDFGIAPLPRGAAGQATSINPAGAVVYKGTKNPDAAWAFVKYLTSPAAQTQIMELKASMPANKEVLAGSFATAFEGSDVLADAIAYARLKPSFKGYLDWTTALQTELDANVFTTPKKTARQALTDVLPELDRILAAQ